MSSSDPASRCIRGSAVNRPTTHQHTLHLNVDVTTHCGSAIVFLTERVPRWRVHWPPSTSVIVSYPSLDLLFARNLCLGRVGNDVDDRDTVQSLHLLEVDVSRGVAIDVFHRETIVRSIGVRLEDASPLLVQGRVHRDV